MATKTRRTAATVLKQLRADRGLTQEGLELETGISQTLISQIENNKRPMTWTTASRLELALGLDRGALDDVVSDVASAGHGRSHHLAPDAGYILPRQAA